MIQTNLRPTFQGLTFGTQDGSVTNSTCVMPLSRFAAWGDGSSMM
jgi:hypothetical protein